MNDGNNHDDDMHFDDDDDDDVHEGDDNYKSGEFRTDRKKSQTIHRMICVLHHPAAHPG
jgi:hypothetical protein